MTHEASLRRPQIGLESIGLLSDFLQLHVGDYEVAAPGDDLEVALRDVILVVFAAFGGQINVNDLLAVHGQLHIVADDDQLELVILARLKGAGIVGVCMVIGFALDNTNAAALSPRLEPQIRT